MGKTNALHKNSFTTLILQNLFERYVKTCVLSSSFLWFDHRHL